MTPRIHAVDDAGPEAFDVLREMAFPAFAAVVDASFDNVDLESALVPEEDLCRAIAADVERIRRHAARRVRGLPVVADASEPPCEFLDNSLAALERGGNTHGRWSANGWRFSDAFEETSKAARTSAPR